MIDPTKHEFSVSVTAIIFFDQSAKWLRHKDGLGILIDTMGHSIGSRYGTRGDRRYSLDDIKKLARALLRTGFIDEPGITNCFARIDSMSQPVYRRKKRRP